MPEPPILLDLDPSGYIQGLGQAEERTERFGAAAGAAAVALGPLQKAMDAATPSRVMLAGFTTFAVMAGRTQAQLSGLAATSRVTGTNFDRLTGNMRQMARELPIGNRGAIDITRSLTRMGLVTTGNAKELNNVSKAVGSADKAWRSWDRNLQGTLPGIGKVTGAVEKLFGNRGTLSSNGAEKRITDTAKAFVRLGAATGESSEALASNMVQLNRSMNTGLSTRRIEAMNDSLTTLSAQSGASATSILTFSKSIAPLAQSAGIGQTQVMGISAAFSKLGDDGFAGANAFSKMMNDLTRSVREGTPQMAAYAQIAGMTTENFDKLFRMKPSEALIRVVEGIGSSGNAPRLLEQIGLEGTRTARVLTNLAQSGDLRTEIDRSVGAYGNGSTLAASSTAFGGLEDSLTTLATTSQQTAEAMGRPLLGSLTALADGMNTALGPLNRMANSNVMQSIGSVIAPILLAALAGMKLSGPLLTGLTAAQAATSGPVTGFRAGYARAGGPLSGLIGRGQGVAEYNRLQAAGLPVGTGRFASINERAGQIGAGVGRFAQGTFLGQGAPVLQRALGLGVGATGVYLRTLSETARLARVPFAEREGSMRPAGDPYRTFMDQRAQLQAQRAAGTLTPQQYSQQIGQAFQRLAGEAGNLRNAFSTLARGVGAVAGQTALSSVALGARGVGRGLGMLAAPLGGPAGLAIAGAGLGFMSYRRSRRENEEDVDAQRNASTWLDEYRVAVGNATESTTTFAARMGQAADAAGAAVQTMGQARKFTEQEMSQALAAGGDPIRDYAGMSTQQVQNTIALQTSSRGMGTEEINRLQRDLALSNFSRSDIEEITSRAGGRSNDVEGLVRAQVGELAGAGRDYGTFGYKKADVVGGLLPGRMQSASNLDFSTLSRTTEQSVTDIATALRDRMGSEAGEYGADYAAANMLNAMDAAVKEAMDRGDTDLQQRLTDAFQTELKLDRKGIQTDELELYGGFSGALSRTGRLPSQYQAALDAQRAAGGELPRAQLPSVIAEEVGRSGNPLAELFRGGNSGIAGVVDSLVGPTGTPESVSLQASTLQAVMRYADETGMSLADLSRNSTEAANAIGNAADAGHQFMLTIRAEAQAVQASRANYMTSGAGAAERARGFAADAALSPNDEATAGIRQQGVQGLRAAEQEAVAQATARLTQQREMQVQRDRARVDFNRQVAYSEADFRRSLLRGEFDYLLQRTRARRDNDRQMLRAQEDFQREMGHAESDFNRSRLYAQRDFNKQMRRTAEDGARAMYDPYQRIQVQATWDPANLLGNLQEQNQAIGDQIKNLGRLRSMGGSNTLIQLLGLDNPTNAQQLAQLVDDVARDPRTLEALNRSARARQELGAGLQQDPANVQNSRAREDFAEQLRRQEEQFRISMERQTSSFARQRERAQADFELGMNDMAVSYRTSLTRAEEDRATAMSRMEESYQTSMSRMAEDVARADTAVVGELADLSAAMNSAISGQFVDFRDLTRSNMTDWLGLLQQFQGDWRSIVEGTGTGARLSVSVTDARRDAALAGRRPMAAGGIVTAATRALVGEAGPEAVIPLNTQGVSILSAAMQNFMSQSEARGLQASQGQSYVTYDSSTSYEDHSTRIEGPITVQANDPQEFMAEARRQAARSNLTAAPVRR